MVYYSYIIINLINGKKYIGEHSTENLKDGYMGSGVLIRKAIKKYGKKNFKKEILNFFDSKQKAYDDQIKWINEYNTLFPNGYNLSPTGGYGVNSSVLSENTKNKIRISNSGKNNGMYGKTHSKEVKNLLKMIKSGSTISDKTRNMYRDGRRKGKNNPMYNKSAFDVWIKKFGYDKALLLKEKHNSNISKGCKGIKDTEESRKRKSESALKRKKTLCSHCGKYFDPGNLKIHERSLG